MYKNLVRLTYKIVRSYARAFTVLKITTKFSAFELWLLHAISCVPLGG